MHFVKNIKCVCHLTSYLIRHLYLVSKCINGIPNGLSATFTLWFYMYDAPSAVEELKMPRKHPTPDKVEAIKDALKHFDII